MVTDRNGRDSDAERGGSADDARTDGRMRVAGDGAGERAQLLLVGSIAIAVIVVGLVVVLNGLLYTEAAASTGTTHELGETEEFDYEARKGVRSLLLRLNHQHRVATPAELGVIADGNVTTYSRLLAESYASSQAGYVNVTYHNDSSAMGRRIVQAADSNVTTNATTGNATEWDPVPPGQRRSIGWLTINADARATDREPAQVVVANATGASINYTINRSTGTGELGLNVTANVSYDGETTVTCEPSRGRVLLDLVDGTDYAGSCSFPGIEAVEGPYNVSVSDGSNLITKYELVVDEPVDSPAYADCTMPAHAAEAPETDPCASPVVWTANVTTTYRGSDVAYENRYNVSVYAEGR